MLYKLLGLNNITWNSGRVFLNHMVWTTSSVMKRRYKRRKFSKVLGSLALCCDIYKSVSCKPEVFVSLKVVTFDSYDFLKVITRNVYSSIQLSLKASFKSITIETKFYFLHLYLYCYFFSQSNLQSNQFLRIFFEFLNS